MPPVPFPLPLDAVSEIVEHLRNDPVSLRRASTLSTAFRDPCQALLFSKLSLSLHTAACGVHESSPSSPPYARELAALFELFHQNPRLRSYIRSLHISDLDGRRIRRDGPIQERKSITGSATPTSVAVVDILNLINPRAITHVAISFHQSFIQYGEDAAESPPVPFLRALSRFLSSPSVKSVDLSGTPFHFLSSVCSKRIAHLGLSWIKPSSSTPLDAGAGIFPEIQPRSLTLGQDSLSISAMTRMLSSAQVDMTGIRHLVLYSRPRTGASTTSDASNSIFKLCKETLEDLTLHLGSSTHSCGVNISIPHLPRLRHLHVEGTLDQLRGVLESIPEGGSTMLSSLTLQITTRTTAPPPDYPSPTASARGRYHPQACFTAFTVISHSPRNHDPLYAWKGLAQLLRSRAVFPALKQLQVEIDTGMLGDRITGLFTPLVKRGVNLAFVDSVYGFRRV